MTPQPGPARRLARTVLPAPVRTVSVKVLPLLGSHKGTRVASREPSQPVPQPARPMPRHAKTAEAAR
jgi:hypothetical protein